MSNAILKGNASGTGSVTLESPNTNSDRTIALPDSDGTMVYANASGNVGIGTATPQGKLDVSSASAGVTAGDLVVDTTNKVVYVGRLSSTSDDNGKLIVRNRVGDALTITGNTAATGTGLFRPTGNTLGFASNSTETMRIDSSGNLLVGATSTVNENTTGNQFKPAGQLSIRNTSGSNLDLYKSGTGTSVNFVYSTAGTVVGTIAINTTSVSYNTSSDYRLKENITPMTGALDVVQQLKPVTYNWKADGSSGQGFIAHELQAVVPDCVTGEKDAVDEEGKPLYQGIDTSFLVATLTKAIQELKEQVDAQALEIQALKGVA